VVKLTVTLAALAFIASACGDDETTGPGGQEVASVTVVPGSVDLALGDTLQLHAEVRDRSGHVIEGRAVSWSSSDPATVGVSTSGRVVGARSGSASVTASVEDVTGSAEISVGSGQGPVIICECAVIVDSVKVPLLSDSTELAAGVYRFRVLDPTGLIRHDSTFTEIVPGDIIVGAQGLGFIRNVQGVSRADDILTVDTEQAGLSEVVIEGAFGSVVPLDEAPGQSPSGNAVWRATQTEYATQSASGAAGPISLKMSFGNVEVCKKTDEGVNACVVFSLKVGDEASLTFNPDIDIGAMMSGGKVEEFHARGSGRVNFHAPLELGVATTAGVDGSFLELVDTVLVRKQKVFVYFVGYVPVVVRVIARFKVELKAKTGIEATWETAVDLGYGVAAGVKYEDGNWTDDTPPVDPPGVDFQPLEFQGIKGKGELKFGPVVSIDVELYGAAGPFLEFGPFAAVAGEISVLEPGSESPDMNAQLNLGFEVDLGVRTNDDIKKRLGIGLEYKLLSFPLFPEVKAIEVFTNNDLEINAMTSARNGDDEILPDHPYNLTLSPAFEVKTPWWNIFDLDVGCKTSNYTLFGGVETECSPLHGEVDPNGTFEYERLRSGSPHAFVIDKGKASNCKFDQDPSEGPFVRSILDTLRVDPRLAGIVEPAVRDFGVECIPWGHLDIDMAVTGDPSDIPDEFLVYWFEELNDATKTGIEPIFNRTAYQDSADSNAIDTAFVSLASTRTIDLIFDNIVVMEVPPNCEVSGDFYQEWDVPSDVTKQTTFSVACDPLSELAFTTETVCVSDVSTCFLDEDGYSVEIRRGPLPGVSGFIVGWQGSSRTAGPAPKFSDFFAAKALLGSDGVYVFEDLQVSEYEIEYQGVADACDIVGLRRIDEESSRDDGFYQDETDVEDLAESVQAVVECEGFPPKGLTVVALGDSAVEISWDAIVDLRAHVAGYSVYRDGEKLADLGIGDSQSAASSQGEVAYIDATVEPDQTYEYTVAMVSEDGREGEESDPLSATTLLPAPGNLAADPAGHTQIDLSWDGVAGSENDVEGYNIYRDGALIDSLAPDARQFSDTALTPNTSYDYEVSALAASGTEGVRSTASAKTDIDPNDTTPPSAATGLTAEAQSSIEIQLTWSPAEDRESGIDFYNIYRDGAKISQVNASPEPAYADKIGLLPSTQYVYTVSAVNGVDLEGPPSVPDTTMTLAAIQDTVVFALDTVIVTDEEGETEKSLGSFEVPAHIAALGVTVYVDLVLSFDEQRDEAFALGTPGQEGLSFIGDEACPVVDDDPSLGRDWVLVGQADLPAGITELVARHAVAFDCYEPHADFETPNSVHVLGVKLLYWR
jgi:hypothetical protein